MSGLISDAGIIANIWAELKKTGAGYPAALSTGSLLERVADLQSKAPEQQPIVITTGHDQSIGGMLRSCGWTMGEIAMDGQYTHYIPFKVSNSVLVAKLFCFASSGYAAGGFRMGVYDENGNRLIDGASVSPAASSMAITDPADVTLTPGRYYFSFYCGTTAANSCLGWRNTPFPIASYSAQQTGLRRAMGCYYEAVGGVQPATATFAAEYASPTYDNLPLVGLTGKTVV